MNLNFEQAHRIAEKAVKRMAHCHEKRYNKLKVAYQLLLEKSARQRVRLRQYQMDKKGHP